MTEDHDAIRCVLAGEIGHFRELVDRHEGAVFRLVRGLVGNRVEPEDLAQETFLRVFAELHRYDVGRAAFGTWVLTIARNLCLNALAKHRPRSGADLPDPQYEPRLEADLSRAEECAALDAALAALPVDQRATWVLREIVGMSYAETAHIEGVDIGTIKSRLHRARSKLRSRLGAPSTKEQVP